MSIKQGYLPSVLVVFMAIMPSLFGQNKTNRSSKAFPFPDSVRYEVDQTIVTVTDGNREER
jgi:hypothetical protein